MKKQSNVNNRTLRLQFEDGRMKLKFQLMQAVLCPSVCLVNRLTFDNVQIV